MNLKRKLKNHVGQKLRSVTCWDQFVVYKHLFGHLLHRCKSMQSNYKFRFQNPLYSLDASAIDLSLCVFPWAAHRVEECRYADSSKTMIIPLSSAHAIKRGIPTLRQIGYRNVTTGKFYEFLTNNFTLAAATIAAIYKDRWQVELFFNAIKQNLKIKAFVGTSRNAVLTQIWIAMITYLLLAFACHSVKSGWTVQRIMRGFN